MAREQRLRRFGVLLLVTGAHVLLLLIPLESDRRERGEPDGDARTSQLIFLRAPPVERRRVPDLRQLAEPDIKTNIEISPPGAIAPISPSASPGAGPSAAPSVDWSEEARRAAADAASRAPIYDPSKCDSTGLGDPALPNCKRPREFKWAPPKAGFANGLPYITLGDRCVVGLGFFGCGLTKPPANGHLFDGMEDPDRERSSVPEGK